MQKSLILPAIVMIAVFASLQAVSEYEIIPYADGLKSKGNVLTQTNSNLVCGDRLCSEANTDKMQTDEIKTIETNTDDLPDKFSCDGKCDEHDLENFVHYWFSLYDARADSSSILDSVADDFKMVFLDTVTFTNSNDFENWYQEYLENFEYVEHSLRTFAAFETQPNVYLASYTADAKMIEHDGTVTEGLYQYSVVFSTHNNQIKIVDFFSTQLDDGYLTPQFEDQTYRMSDHDTIVEEGKYIIKKVFFPCSGEQCAGYLYLPYDMPSGEKAPGIVMSNAITSVKEITLPNYGKAFAEAGYVALGIDYRYWGESGGEPRNHIVGYEQQQDIRDAITWLQNQPEVDPERLGGFGVSFGGGHQLYLATFDSRLDAVSVAVTAINGVDMWQGIFGDEAFSFMLELDKNSRQEKFENDKNYTYLNAWGNTNDPNCVFCIEEGFKFYNLAQTTFAPEFENKVTLQSINNILEYNPDYAVHLASPTAVLYIHATQDVIPIEIVRQIYERTSEPKKLVEIDSLHVEVYTDEPYFTTAVDETIDWFDIYVKNSEVDLR